MLWLSLEQVEIKKLLVRFNTSNVMVELVTLVSALHYVTSFNTSNVMVERQNISNLNKED